MSLSRLRELMMGRGAWLQPMGSQRGGQDWAAGLMDPQRSLSFTRLPFTSEPLAITHLFTSCIVLLFPECHRVGIIHCVAFSDWLLHLGRNDWFKIHPCLLWLGNLFPFIASRYFTVFTIVNLFIYWRTIWLFLVWVIMNKVAVKFLCVWLCIDISS